MVTLNSAACRQACMLRLARLAPTAAVLVFGLSTAASAQGRAHLSNDLQRHLDAGDATATTVIVTGTQEQVAAIAARHGLRVKRALTSGASLEVPAGKLDEVASDPDVPQLSGDQSTHGEMFVTDVAIGADQAWSGDFASAGSGSASVGSGSSRTNGVTGKGIGVALLDSGVTVVPQLRGQVSARVDMIDAKGTGADEWGHGTHLAGVIAGAGTIESSARGVAPGAHIVGVKVLGADGSGRISDLIEGIDWVIANRRRYQINVINLSLGAPVETSWRNDPVCQAIERAWRVNIVTVTSAGNFGKDDAGHEVLGGARQLPVCDHRGDGEHEGNAVPQRRCDCDLQLARADGDRSRAEAGSAGAGKQGAGIAGAERGDCSAVSGEGNRLRRGCAAGTVGHEHLIRGRRRGGGATAGCESEVESGIDQDAAAGRS